MDTIDLTLPDFLQAKNRGAPPPTKKRGGGTDWIMPKSVGEKPKQRHAKDRAEAAVSKDH
jgi:hypothetical protein